MTPQDAIWNALSDYSAMQDIQPYELDKVAAHVVSHIREHCGYVIKRAVPPCRGYEGDNDASGE